MSFVLEGHFSYWASDKLVFVEGFLSGWYTEYSEEYILEI